MAKSVHYSVDGEVPCKKKGDLQITSNRDEVTCKRCLNRLKNNPTDTCNKISKRCSKCNEILLIDEFWNNKSEPDGKCLECIKCIRVSKGTYSEPEILPDNCKKCTNCKEMKEFSEFNRAKDKKSGLTSWCKKCTYEKTRPKAIHYFVGNKPYCGDSSFVKYSENIEEVNCKRCLHKYNERIEYLANDGLKKCRKCELVLPVEKFLNNSQKKDGKNNYCRECQHGLYKEYEVLPEGYKRCTK